MKTPEGKILLLFLLLPLSVFCQDLSGIWTGRLSNDSNTLRKDQTYELALTEYKGKVYGYSYTTFIFNDTLYYIIKRVKGTITDDVCEVEDDEIVAHNFFHRIDKKVKVTQTFRRNKRDSSWHLEGNWKTNKTKEYYSLTGGLALKEEKDFGQSRLLQHLGDLKRDDDLAFYKPEPVHYLPAPRKVTIKKEEPVIARQDPSKKKPASSSLATVDVPAPEPVEREVNLQRSTAAITTDKSTPSPAVTPGRTIAGAQVSNLDLTLAEVEKPMPSDSISLKKQDMQAVALEKNQPRSANSTLVQGNKIEVNLEQPVFEERKKNLIQSFTYQSDSLVLALYDNGEVDGDTVTVTINGEPFLVKQGLKSTAIKKTIYLNPGEDKDLEILLFADNLGRFPPNTGLLIIRDGETRYEIRFSADFEHSAAIRLRRQKN